MRTSVETQRKEFVALASKEGADISRLCRGFGISRKSGYKWLARSETGDEQWASDRSRRPHQSPRRTAREVEQQIVAVAKEFPCWGARKLHRILQDRGAGRLPAVSTVDAILRRHQRERIAGSRQQGPLEHFERATANDLWQMDFKHGFELPYQTCYPLTIVDDHSRFSPCVRACANQRIDSVQPALIETFRRYGLPRQMLMDNGSCWGKATSRYTQLGAWLIRLGVAITHGRFYHPQTQGKNERFNRTLQLEAIRGRQFADLQDCQRTFDAFRYRYNHVRPHQALDLQTPVSRYQPSSVLYPEVLPAIEYPQADQVRRVMSGGAISFGNVFYQVGRAFAGQPVALRITAIDGQFAVYYCHHQVALIDIRSQTSTSC